MQFSLAAIILGLAASASASVMHTVPRDAVLNSRQNDNRPVPTGTCCVANTSLKQDTCTSESGAQGRCVPGGNDCKCRSSSWTQAWSRRCQSSTDSACRRRKAQLRRAVELGVRRQRHRAWELALPRYCGQRRASRWRQHHPGSFSGHGQLNTPTRLPYAFRGRSCTVSVS